MGYQNVPDHLGRSGKEVFPVLELDTSLVNQLQIDLVDHGGALQGMARALQPELAFGQLVQLLVNQWH